MTGASITMMIIALATVWGGLGAAILHLRSHPDDTSGHDV